MKIFGIAFFILAPLMNCAQENLVINPSFEDYTELPSGFSNNGKSFATYWYIPSMSSPDYFNNNCDSSYLSDAARIFNYDKPHTGSSCIGLYPLLWNGYMEHITGELSKPLERNEVYRVVFWIKYSGNVCQFSADCFGVYFSIEKFQMYPMDPFYDYFFNNKLKANIETTAGNFITNDSTWVEVNFLYKASGGEKYLTLGKFYNDKIKLKTINNYRQANIQFTNKKEKFIRKKEHQKILLLNNNFIDRDSIATNAYYFIDDISVSIVHNENSTHKK